MLPKYYDWTKADKESATQLTFITGASGQLYPYPENALPTNVAKGMPNLHKCFISGYAIPESVEGGVEAIGELLVTRIHDKAMLESGKAYVYLIGLDQDKEPWFRGPYKPYDSHYFSLESGVPTEELFGRIKSDKLDQKVIF